MRYLLDTSVLIDYAKGIDPGRSTVVTLTAGRNVLGVCPVVIAEFYSGLSAPEQERWREFFDALVCWDITREAAMRAGQDRYTLARKGVALAVSDVLIAAVAREQGAILVTANPRDFPMPDIQVLAIRDAGR